MQDLGDFPDGRIERKYLAPDSVAVALRDNLQVSVSTESDFVHVRPASVVL